MTKSASDQDINSTIFGTAVSVVTLLAPLLIGVALGYEKLAALSWMKERVNWLLFGLLVALLVGSTASSLTLYGLTTGRYETRAVIWLMACLLVATGVISFVAVVSVIEVAS